MLRENAYAIQRYVKFPYLWQKFHLMAYFYNGDTMEPHCEVCRISRLSFSAEDNSPGLVENKGLLFDENAAKIVPQGKSTTGSHLQSF